LLADFLLEGGDAASRGGCDTGSGIELVKVEEGDCGVLAEVFVGARRKIGVPALVVGRLKVVEFVQEDGVLAAWGEKYSKRRWALSMGARSLRELLQVNPHSSV
jgi:hypothetical protein